MTGIMQCVHICACGVACVRHCCFAVLLCGVALEIALRDCIQSNWGVALGGVCFGVCVWSGDRDRH